MELECGETCCFSFHLDTVDSLAETASMFKVLSEEMERMAKAESLV